MNSIDYIIIHCTATKEGLDFHVQDIDRWHREKGWNGCGYHYVIALDGTIETGRNEGVVGAHCNGHNKDSLGIVYVGGLDSEGHSKDTRTIQQRAALYHLLTNLKYKYPNAKIVGHNYFNKKKSCPCFDVKKEYTFVK